MATPIPETSNRMAGGVKSNCTMPLEVIASHVLEFNKKIWLSQRGDLPRLHDGCSPFARSDIAAVFVHVKWETRSAIFQPSAVRT